MNEYTGRDASLLRQSHGLRQVDVARAMIPPVSRERVHQFEHRERLSPEQFGRIGAAILAVSRPTKKSSR